MPVKYLGSKRRLVPTLVDLARLLGASTAIDLFTGSTRVATAWRRDGRTVTAVDRLAFAHGAAVTYVATSMSEARRGELARALGELNALDGCDGFITDTYCRSARFFTPENGRRIDAVRAAITARFAGSWLEPVLLTALIEAADRVDSTTGLQMAYLKQWAARATRPLALRAPDIPDGPPGRAVLGDAETVCATLGRADLAYLDPPYNQHRYEANYHLWETLWRGDEPDTYGVARKATRVRDSGDRSAFNDRERLPAALQGCIDRLDARVVAVSCSDEGWLRVADVVEMCAARGPAVVLSFDSARYVGARIGIHDRSGAKVGTVSHLRNTEYVVVAGNLTAAERDAVARLGPVPTPGA